MLGLYDKIRTFVQAGTGGDLRAVCEDVGCELVEFNGETEHVHLLVNFPPTLALSGSSTA